MLLDLDPWVRESIYLCHQVDFIKNMDITGALHEFKVNVVIDIVIICYIFLLSMLYDVNNIPSVVRKSWMTWVNLKCHEEKLNGMR